MHNESLSQRNTSAAWSLLRDAVRRFHDDQGGVAMTEYIIIFSLISFGATIALLSCAVYVKGYRDFLVWWLSHPAI